MVLGIFVVLSKLCTSAIIAGFTTIMEALSSAKAIQVAVDSQSLDTGGILEIY